MLSSPFFLVGFCLLLTHELDAVRCEEWRILPGLSMLGAEAGYRAFTVLHVPLYAVLLWGLFGDDTANHGLIVALDAFFIVHLLFHLLLRNRPNNHFGSLFSRALFVGAGLCGALDLLLLR